MKTSTFKQLAGTLEDLNNTLDPELKRQIVDFETFKKLNSGKEGTDGAVANIKSVIIIKHGYEFIFNDGSTWTVYYSGYMSKNDSLPSRPLCNGRVRMNNFGGKNTSMYPEKLIGIAIAILEDKLPSTFEGLAVNVMDGSGKDATAKKLGISYNIREDNLEWTINQERNFSLHGHNLYRLKRITGHVYRYSANDLKLFDALGLHEYEWVKQYMKKTYTYIV